MSGPDPLDPEALARRIAELESRWMHAERLHDTLNEVVTEQAGRIERLEREVGRLREALQQAAVPRDDDQA